MVWCLDMKHQVQGFADGSLGVSVIENGSLFVGDLHVRMVACMTEMLCKGHSCGAMHVQLDLLCSWLCCAHALGEVSHTGLFGQTICWPPLICCLW